MSEYLFKRRWQREGDLAMVLLTETLELTVMLGTRGSGITVNRKAHELEAARASCVRQEHEAGYFKLPGTVYLRDGYAQLGGVGCWASVVLEDLGVPAATIFDAVLEALRVGIEHQRKTIEVPETGVEGAAT